MEKTQEIDIPKVTGITKKQQQIAVLSVLSNCNQKSYANSWQELQDQANTRIEEGLKDLVLTPFVGNWELVWGPCLENSQLGKNNKEHANQWITNNTMYVAKTQDPETPSKTIYVVAIAGTNAVSSFGWLTEDAKVEKMVAWGNVPNAKISDGSNIGLNILLDMKDKGVDLIQFLSSVSLKGNVEIATCGHSLGGALSPLVALKLVEMKESKGFSNLTISCYPSAGPTSGNAKLAKYAEVKLANNYHSVINAYDIVPHAWNVQDLLKIKTIYDTPKFGNIKLSEGIKGLIDGLYVLLILKNYTRINAGKEFLFEGAPKDKNEPSDTLKEDMLFLNEAAYQHTTVYNQANAFNFPQAVSNQIQKYIQPSK
jgi:hypothetical protein